MQDKGKKGKMVPGEMTGKMMPLKERQARESAFAKELDLVKKTKRVTPTTIVGKKETVNYKMAKPFKDMVIKKMAERKSAKSTSGVIRDSRTKNVIGKFEKKLEVLPKSTNAISFTSKVVSKKK